VRDFVRLSRSFYIPGGKLSATTPYIWLTARHRGGANLGVCRPITARDSLFMRFTFIHAADLHIDSPFAGLGLKDPVVAERFAHAGRRAVEALIDETISAKAAFLVISGDIFDGDWKDVTTGLFFARALGCSLVRAAILQVARLLGL
jgi:hypothetical protein